MAAAVDLRRSVRDHYSAYIARPDASCGLRYKEWGYGSLSPTLTEVVHCRPLVAACSFTSMTPLACAKPSGISPLTTCISSLTLGDLIDVFMIHDTHSLIHSHTHTHTHAHPLSPTLSVSLSLTHTSTPTLTGNRLCCCQRWR